MSVIHDLGYARYSGERRPPGTLWRVIMRQQLSHAWKTFWRYKLWVGVAVVVTTILGAVMILQADSTVQSLRRLGDNNPVRFLDTALPRGYFFYRLAAFIVSMTIGAAVIARDQESGAFTFYFSRPVRPIDYVLGKLAGMTILMGILFIAGPFLLSIFRLVLSKDTDEVFREMVIVPKVLAIGALATLPFASMPLAVSALTGRRTLALGAWAAYYIAGSTLVAVIGSLAWRPLMSLDIGMAIDAFAFRLFGFEASGSQRLPPLWSSAASILLQSTIAIVIIFVRVRREAEGAVGGSS